jgi:hypothetical protein
MGRESLKGEVMHDEFLSWSPRDLSLILEFEYYSLWFLGIE